MKINRLAAFALCAAMCMSFPTAVSAEFYRDENGVGHYMKDNGTLAKGLYYTLISRSPYYDEMLMCKYDSKGNFVDYYTGFSRTSAGRYYYLNGKRMTGWQQINGNYYHFNSKGIADTGRKKIAGCTYTFDKNGIYTGRRTVKGARPSDFAVSFSYGYDDDYQFDTKTATVSKLIGYDRYSPYMTAYHEFTDRDKQVMWSFVSEKGLFQADTSTYYGGSYVERSIIEHFPDADTIPEEITPCNKFTLTITANGHEYVFSGTEGIEQVTAFDETAAAVWETVQYMQRYLNAATEFKSFPESTVEYV